MTEIFEESPTVFIKFHRGLAAAKSLMIKPRSGKPRVEIFWGPSGTGKSYKAFSENPGAYVLPRPCTDGKIWWDHYEGQTTVIIDEFYGWIKYDLLLRILDAHPIIVPFKGGMVNLAATHFIITSNVSWEEWYNLEIMPYKGEALRRRITEFATITHMERLELPLLDSPRAPSPELTEA